MTPDAFRAVIRDIERDLKDGEPYTLTIITQRGQLILGVEWSKVEGDDTVIRIGAWSYIALSFIERVWVDG